MRIRWKGRQYEVPIDDERGIRPRMIDDDDSNYVEQFTMTIIPVKKIHPDAKIPKRQTEEAAGLDLTSMKDEEFKPGEIKIVGTGIAMKIPKGYYRQIKPRSSLAMIGLTVDGGVIDADYIQEIKMILAY
jgi:dUTPase